MAKTNHQKLAEQVAAFRHSLEQGFAEGINGRSGSTLDSFHKDVFCDYWLRCETAKERQNRLSLHTAACDLHRKSHAVYYEQYQKQDSKLWINLSSPAAPIYANLLKICPYLTARGHRTTSYNYEFSPVEGECLEIALRKVTQCIKQKSASRHLNNLAKSYHEQLIKSLFEGTGIRPPVTPKQETVPAYGLKIIRDMGFNLEKEYLWEDQKFLTILPGRFAISRERAQLYLIETADKFLEDPVANELFGETLLVLWILLACAHHRRRFCAVADIFKITESDFSYHRHDPWLGLKFLPTYTLKIAGEAVPIPATLSHMILTLSDQRTKNKSIIRVDRSTVEGYLLSITEKLKFDHNADPVTPETFLEAPHLFGEHVRHRPKKS